MNPTGEQKRNIDPLVTDGFGDEWTRFDQSKLSVTERQAIFSDYFSIFPWDRLPSNAIGADIGCGSGRWATIVAPRVALLYCVDGSALALSIAKRNLQHLKNCEFIEADIGSLGIPLSSLDFAYSLGVLHHAPETLSGIKSCVSTLKPGAPFLMYLYYRFDTRPVWYRAMWAASNLLRRIISTLPYKMRFLASQLLSIFVYWPMARTAYALRRYFRVNTDGMPLAYYSDKSFYVMRTDALDRFGTRLEQRFTRSEIDDMMTAAGLVDIRFSDRPPYWCAIGTKRIS
jgi:SAM-dependent methyltransferase